MMPLAIQLISTHYMAPELGFAHATFFQKLKGIILNIWSRLIFELDTVPSNNVAIKKYFRENMPGLKKMYSRLSLLLINPNLVVDSIRPYVPAVVPIELVHIVEPKELPKV